MDPAKTGCLRIELGTAKRQRGFETFVPESFVDGSRLAGVQNSESNGGIGIEQPHTQETIFPVIDDGEVTGLAGAILFEDAVGENPGMTLSDDFFGGSRNAKAEALMGSLDRKSVV